MASLRNDDCLLVGRNNVDYKVSYQELAGSLENDIAFSGNYNDLTNKPEIGNGKITIALSDTVGIGSFKTNQKGDQRITLPRYSTFSGDYNDLTNKPAAGAAPNDGKLTIKNSDGSEAGSFTANQAGNTDITLPAGPNDGKLTIKNSDGSEAGSFTANQAGNTEITLPAGGFSGDYEDLTNKPTIGNGTLIIYDGDRNQLGEFKANQDDYTFIDLPKIKFPKQFTKNDGAWAIRLDPKDLPVHKEGDEHYMIDSAVCDPDSEKYFLVCTRYIGRSNVKNMKDKTLEVDIYMSRRPGENFDDFEQNNCRRGDIGGKEFKVQNYVVNSLTYDPRTAKLYWLQYEDMGGVSLYSSTYDASQDTKEKFVMSDPAKLKTGSVGLCIQTGGSPNGNEKELVVWEFDSGKLQFTLIDGGPKSDMGQIDVGSASVSEVFCVSDIQRLEDKDGAPLSGIFFAKGSNDGQLIHGRFVNDRGQQFVYEDLGVDLQNHPLLAFAAFETTILLTFGGFCIIRDFHLESGYLIPRQMGKNSYLHAPKIGKIENQLIFQIWHSQQFHLLYEYKPSNAGHPQILNEELAMTKSWGVQTMRSNEYSEAIMFGLGMLSSGCYMTTRWKNYKAYWACAARVPIEGQRVDDGQIILDKELGNGQRYFFAQKIKGFSNPEATLVALSSQSHSVSSDLAERL